MSVILISLAVIVGLVVVVLLWGVGAYNGLIQARNQSENGLSQIDVQLKRRHDLIPNLVETVKGYATHEKGTLEKVIQARNMAVGATGVTDRAQAENALSGTLKSLFAVAEAYPDLKANQNFLQLQEEIGSTENKISFSRQFYNDATMSYNTRLEMFPTNIFAGIFQFKRRDMFEVNNAAEREAPKVSFQ